MTKKESILSEEIYRSLGSLEAKMEANEKANAVIIDGIKEIRNHQIAQNGKLEKAHNRIDDMEPILEKAAEQGNDWQDTKTRAKWIMGLGFLGSAGGGLSFSKIISGIFGT